MTETQRQLIVVDLETTGLHDDAAILEVAAVNVDTGEELHFVPWVSTEALAKAEPKAMQINRYYERGTFERVLAPNETLKHFERLRDMLRGNTFAGSNPAFDAGLVARAVVVIKEPSWYYAYFGPNRPEAITNQGTEPVGRVWHHRLADLAAYAAGVLGVDPRELPGLDAVLDRLGLPMAGGERHTAPGDAQATVAAFKALRNISINRKGVNDGRA